MDKTTYRVTLDVPFPEQVFDAEKAEHCLRKALEYTRNDIRNDLVEYYGTRCDPVTLVSITKENE